VPGRKLLCSRDGSKVQTISRIDVASGVLGAFPAVIPQCFPAGGDSVSPHGGGQEYSGRNGPGGRTQLSAVPVRKEKEHNGTGNCEVVQRGEGVRLHRARGRLR